MALQGFWMVLERCYINALIHTWIHSMAGTGIVVWYLVFIEFGATSFTERSPNFPRHLCQFLIVHFCLSVWTSLFHLLSLLQHLIPGISSCLVPLLLLHHLTAIVALITTLHPSTMLSHLFATTEFWPGTECEQAGCDTASWIIIWFPWCSFCRHWEGRRLREINAVCTVFAGWANCIYFVFFVGSYVLECSYCGVIYRSRQHWYGNVDPEKTVVRTEIRHVWPDVGSSVAFR